MRLVHSFVVTTPEPHRRRVVCSYEGPGSTCREICELFSDPSITSYVISDNAVGLYGPGIKPRLFYFVTEALKHNTHILSISLESMVFDWHHAEIWADVLLKNHTLLSVGRSLWASNMAEALVKNLLEANQFPAKTPHVLEAFLFFLALRLPFQVVVVFADFFWSFLKLNIIETVKRKRSLCGDFGTPPKNTFLFRERPKEPIF